MTSIQPQLRQPPKTAPNALLHAADAQPGILVVDDDPMLRALLTVTLQKSGFTVWPATGGAEAIQVYQRQRSRIDVVLLDVRMPGLDGPHTLAKLQRLNPAVACCFMSGHTGGYTVAELLGRGALHFFDKPFRMDEVLRVLGSLAEQHGRTQASSA